MKSEKKLLKWQLRGLEGPLTWQLHWNIKGGDQRGGWRHERELGRIL